MEERRDPGKALLWLSLAELNGSDEEDLPDMMQGAAAQMSEAERAAVRSAVQAYLKTDYRQCG